MMRSVLVIAALAVAGCSPITPERAAERCEERARAAQGPELGLTIGANSNSGSFVNGNISISSDAIRGRDPLEVYERCVVNLTGELPIRPPQLRDL